MNHIKLIRRSRAEAVASGHSVNLHGPAQFKHSHWQKYAGALRAEDKATKATQPTISRPQTLSRRHRRTEKGPPVPLRRLKLNTQGGEAAFK